MNYKKTFLLLAGIVIFSCSNPAKIDPVIPNANLSAQDKLDITALGAHFSARAIDSIKVGHPYYFYYNPDTDTTTNFYGNVVFDSLFTDTDKISYQSLTFYNKYWSAYSSETIGDTSLVFINNWYSKQAYLSSYEKLMFTIDTETIIVRTYDSINKVLVIGYLQSIQSRQFSVADTSLHYNQKLSTMSNIQVKQKGDTTQIELGYNFTTYVFNYYMGNMQLAAIWMLEF